MSTSRLKTKEIQSFSLVLDGLSALPDEQAERIYRRCRDATVVERDGLVTVAFDRRASSFSAAVLSAIRDLQRLGFRADRILFDELVGASEIAQRVKRSRESVRLLIEGLRGPGHFPPPAEVIGQRQKFWRWIDIQRWFADYEDREPEPWSADAFIAAVNGLLQAGRQIQHLPRAEAKALRQLAKDEELVAAL
ncbi:MAG TPA: hypothetical protein VGR87_12880 [Candidatus Limnocylindria bacterium]|jgi:hypothetical protein|nr:hypothetical protein [Candidatus Limnocylindria bacterium]